MPATYPGGREQQRAIAARGDKLLVSLQDRRAPATNNISVREIRWSAVFGDAMRGNPRADPTGHQSGCPHAARPAILSPSSLQPGTRIPSRRNARAPQSLEGQVGEGRCVLVRLDGQTSNALFDTLSDWNEQLKHAGLDRLEPRP